MVNLTEAEEAEALATYERMQNDVAGKIRGEVCSYATVQETGEDLFLVTFHMTGLVLDRIGQDLARQIAEASGWDQAQAMDWAQGFAAHARKVQKQASKQKARKRP